MEEKLEYLKTTKELIKQAINNKGVEVLDTDLFNSYSEKINLISGGRDIRFFQEGGSTLHNLNLFIGSNIIIQLVNSGSTRHSDNYIEPVIFTDCDGTFISNLYTSLGYGWGQIYYVENLSSSSNVSTAYNTTMNVFIL